MKYILYTRTSTRDQHNGLDAQRNTAHRFIKEDDTIVREYSEQESGKSTTRVELNKALIECKQEGYTLLIARLDRLSRNAKFTFELMDSQVDFVCCDMPSANTVTIGIMSVLAQSERERISSNTKLALQVLIQKGVQLGTDNLTREGVLKSAANRKKQAVADNHQATKIIIRLRNEGMRYLAIAQELNADGYTTSKGNQYLEQTVSRLYKRATTQQQAAA